MTALEPRAHTDMTGWHPLTCEQYETVMGRHRDMPIDVFKVASTITDPDGHYGSPLVFTEWWYMDAPLLRSYLWGRRDGERRCEHYGAMDDTAAVTP